MYMYIYIYIYKSDLQMLVNMWLMWYSAIGRMWELTGELSSDIH